VDNILTGLQTVLEKLGVSFELQNLDDDEINIKGGFCEVKKRRRMILDKRTTRNDRIKRILEFLRQENLENIFIPPRIRELIERNEDRQKPAG